MHAGLPNCIRNEMKAWDFISSKVIHSGKMHMLKKKTRATNNVRNHFELLKDFVFVLVSHRRLNTESLNFVGHLIRFKSGQNFVRVIKPYYLGKVTTLFTEACAEIKTLQYSYYINIRYFARSSCVIYR